MRPPGCGRAGWSTVLDGPGAEAPACRRAHSSSIARSTADSSAVGDSGWLGGSAGGAGATSGSIGTGTTLPQSGHLPNFGGLAASTFSRRPHGQANRMNPSDGFRAPPRRILTRAPHVGQMTRSEPSVGIGSGWPQRQIAWGMGKS
jgi:hypothetical protein